MSIVAVHGPNTFGSKAVQEAGPVLATVSAANGLVWTFKLDRPSDRPAADFDWTFTGGTPASQADSKGPITVTYATPGAKTATLVVSGASALEPPNGSYPITVTAVSGAAPQLMITEPGGEEPPPEMEEYDPADHSVKQVLAHADANPDQVQTLYDDEEAGKARTTLLDGLEERGANPG